MKEITEPELEMLRKFQEVTGFNVRLTLAYASSAILQIGIRLEASDNPDEKKAGQMMLEDYRKLPVY